MSVIPTVYNQGTGLIGATTSGATVPDNVDDLIVNNTLLVGGQATFNGPVTINNTLTVTGTLSFEDVDITGTFTVVSMTSKTASSSTTLVAFSPDGRPPLNECLTWWMKAPSESSFRFDATKTPRTTTRPTSAAPASTDGT